MVDHTTITAGGNFGVPLIAILRGITPGEVQPVASALYEAGVRLIEIPLNSPDALQSIKKLVELHGDSALCGAGTVLKVEEVDAIHGCGGKLVVSPNVNPAVIQAALDLEMLPIPGVATITEAFTAIEAGAKQLKLFPAGDLGPGYLKSIKAVLPEAVNVVAVGNINEENLKAFWSAGASGFGVGGSLYSPGMEPDQVAENAKRYLSLIDSLD